MTIGVPFQHKFLEECFLINYNQLIGVLTPYTLPIAVPTHSKKPDLISPVECPILYRISRYRPEVIVQYL
jgi:hypothetical protein